MTLMPVSNTSSIGSWSSKFGAARWIGLRLAVFDRTELLAGHRVRDAFLERVAEHVEQPAHRLDPDRHRDRTTGVDRLHAADETVGRGHRDAAGGRVAQLLGDLERQVDALCSVLDADRVVDLGQVAFGELDVDDGSEHLLDPAFGGLTGLHRSHWNVLRGGVAGWDSGGRVRRTGGGSGSRRIRRRRSRRR
jgi:hypothetical protein